MTKPFPYRSDNLRGVPADRVDQVLAEMAALISLLKRKEAERHGRR